MVDRIAMTFLGIMLLAIALVPLFTPKVALPVVQVGYTHTEFTEGSILLLGDVMLGRHVETLIRKNKKNYPFSYVTNLFNSVDMTIANFEASVPVKHTQTPDGEFNLYVSKENMEILKEVGIGRVSLANNHSFDSGSDGFKNTVTTCHTLELVCPGNPTELTDSSLDFFMLGDTHVAVMYLYEPTVDINDPWLEILIKRAKEQSEVQIIFIHWGEEYKEVHNDNQAALAHYFIDKGFDLVVGHHPHVVQDIEIYKTKPIFYSLGNFIFDQYFSEEVQEGLGIKMNVGKNDIEYTLIPFTSIDTPSQPRPMTLFERSSFFSNLSTHSDSKITLDAEHATLRVQR